MSSAEYDIDERELSLLKALLEHAGRHGQLVFQCFDTPFGWRWHVLFGPQVYEGRTETELDAYKAALGVGILEGAISSGFSYLLEDR